MRWPFPSSKLTLHPADVHIWAASLDSEAESCEELSEILSPDEKERATHLVFPLHRDRFIAARALLRMVLSSYVHHPPQDIEFRYSRHGKPSLAKSCGGDLLQFNLSHSEGLVLYAVTQSRPVGIDIECIRRLNDMGSMVKGFLSESERHQLYSLPSNQQLRAFFAAWTRKEAYLKAIGAGISESMQHVEVSLAPETPAKFLKIPCPAGHSWQLLDLDPASGYVASLAVEGRDLDMRCLRWPQWRPDPILASARNPLDDQLN